MNKTFLLKIFNNDIDYNTFKKSVKNIKKKKILEEIDLDIINNSSINDNDDILAVIIINLLKKYSIYPDIIKYVLFLQNINTNIINNIDSLSPIRYFDTTPLGCINLNWLSVIEAFFTNTYVKELTPRKCSKITPENIKNLYWISDCGTGSSVYPDKNESEILTFPTYMFLKELLKENLDDKYLIYGGDTYYYDSNKNLEDIFSLWKKCSENDLDGKLIFCPGNHDFYNMKNCFDFLKTNKDTWKLMYEDNILNTIKYLYINNNHLLILNSTYFANGFFFENGSLVGINKDCNNKLSTSIGSEIKIANIEYNYNNGNPDNYNFTQYNLIIDAINDICLSKDKQSITLFMHHPAIEYRKISNKKLLIPEKKDIFYQILSAIKNSNLSSEQKLEITIVSGHSHSNIIFDPIIENNITFKQITSGNAGFISKNINNEKIFEIKNMMFLPKESAERNEILGNIYINRSANAYTKINLETCPPTFSLITEKLKNSNNNEFII